MELDNTRLDDDDQKLAVRREETNERERHARAEPRIGVKEEPDIKSGRRRTKPVDHDEKQSLVTCDEKPRTRQQEKLSARRRVEGLMKHVQDGREERKKQPGTGPKNP